MVEITEVELNEVINKFKKLVFEDKYTISSGENRVQNDLFITNNLLSSKLIKKMLLELTTKDCVGVEKHYKDNNKIVYIFIKEYDINTMRNIKRMRVYIKFLICLVRCQEQVVVISFHNAESNKKYIFKKEDE